MDIGNGSALLSTIIFSTKTSISPVSKSGFIKSFDLEETFPSIQTTSSLDKVFPILINSSEFKII